MVFLEWSITDTKFSLKTVTLLHIITETVRFNYIPSSRRQVPREIQRLACEQALPFRRASQEQASEGSRETRFARPNRRACLQAIQRLDKRFPSLNFRHRDVRNSD